MSDQDRYFAEQLLNAGSGKNGCGPGQPPCIDNTRTQQPINKVLTNNLNHDKSPEPESYGTLDDISKSDDILVKFVYGFFDGFFVAGGNVVNNVQNNGYVTHLNGHAADQRDIQISTVISLYSFIPAARIEGNAAKGYSSFNAFKAAYG